ncbi:Putative phage protein [Photobacterium marinum]|uniref:Putative phage protein n=1 Tax=Photobacterium marinum TaxID=1056511 RepID=L8JAQ3_9GAMM|nr:P-loop NTPase fold protein [Photobacterium marinum]ELR65866.1 Putative phage protein [Photobacterium marinum]
MAALENEFDWSTPYHQESEDKKKVKTFPADQLDRAKYATFLTNYLVEVGKVNGYVLNLNASWGTGKTYFLNRWKADLEDHYPVVYIDAWKQDFSNDPMMAVVTSIITQLRDLSQEKGEQLVRNISNKLWGFCKQVTPEVTKAIVKKISGVDVEKVIEGSDEEDLFDSKDFADAAGKLIGAAIKDHEAKLKSIDDFKKAISAFIEDVVDCSGKQNPAFIFIDELDRCRPTYAVEMLEVIKHFFDMKNVVFVVATDTEQLQHAVKAVYGTDFNAATYLGRFFRRRCTLKEVSRKKFITQKVLQLNLNHEELTPLIWPDISEGLHRYVEILANTADAFSLPLREVEQLIDKINVIIRNLGETRVNLYHLASFLVIHDRYHDFYNCYFGNRLTKGPSSNVAAMETIRHYIDDTNINIEVEIGLTPHQHFSKGLVHQGSVGYGLNFNDGFYPFRFDSILQYQMEIFKNNLTAQYYYDEIAGRRHRQQSTDSTQIVHYEIAALKPTLSQYQDWIELAATFDD